MLFVPEKGKLYRWAVHTKPIFRYLISCSGGIVIFSLYFFLMQPWLAGAIELKRAQLNRSKQIEVDMVATQHAIAQADKSLHEYKIRNDQTKGAYREKDQLLFVFDAAEKSGLSVQSFSHANEKKRDWKQKRYKSLQACGTFHQIDIFLKKISHEAPLVQCKKLALQRADQGRFSLQGELEFIQVS